ncbi:uncharacterized protein LOC126907513 isoform X1 [Daktulosphaira vitifoliae]|uniref:uncharacterized protein LOC126907513 isoform X1 n=1 Tax=Daktulosphaira vitifoliae TaxID=58002 RepID=UPI0021AAC238|nr:uncharacterized protein LOC126907513 isoform X1 [Daktulosphaira vitifoliae]
MIIFKIFIFIKILFVNIKCVISLDLLVLHCNFSEHLFNYFKYSEKYLFNFENNISELELRNYGTAVQSHGEIVMIMLDSLREMDKKYVAGDIMAVNLYLNNVSGSINMIGNDENGEFNRIKNSQNLLKGYKILHRSIVERLEYFINERCLNVSGKNYFISLTNFQEPIKHSLEVLRNEIEKLNNKIIKIMKEYLTVKEMFVMNNTDILKSYCDIIKQLALAFERKSYNIFNPKNILFYDLMENRPCFMELDLASGSQAKQYAKYNSNKELYDVLDMVRYAPMHKKSTNNYQITLFDVFRFIKFDFDFKNVKAFQNVVNAAILRPIIVIVRFYISIVYKFIFLIKFKNKDLKYIMKYKIIKMGQHIVENMKSFMDLNLFDKIYTDKMYHAFNIIYNLVSSFKDHNNLFTNKNIQLISKFFYQFLRRHSLCYKMSHLQIENIREDNISSIYDLANKEVNKIALLTSELKKYQYIFEAVNRYIPSEYINDSKLKIILKNYIPYEQLGNHEDIYRSLYFPGDNTNDVTIHYSPSLSDENDEMNNDDDKDFDMTTQTYYTPKYLVDYLLYK